MSNDCTVEAIRQVIKAGGSIQIYPKYLVDSMYLEILVHYRGVYASFSFDLMVLANIHSTDTVFGEKIGQLFTEVLRLSKS